MVFEKITGNISLYSSGKNAFIKRENGKKISIPPVEILNNLLRKQYETQSKEDSEKVREFLKKFPQIEEGDILTTGKDSFILVGSTYDKGRDKPINLSESKSIFISGDGAEVKVTGVENWEREDKKNKIKYSGKGIKNFEILKEGYYYCNYSNNEDILKTPIADIKFKKTDGTITLDFYKKILYMIPIPSLEVEEKGNGIEFVLKNSKKFYLDNEKAIKEIIISSGGIYKKSMFVMDNLNYFFGAQLSSLLVSGSAPLLIKDNLKKPKELMQTMKEGEIAVEMLKGLSSSEVSELGKSGGMNEKQMKQLMDATDVLKSMKDKIPFDKINESLGKLNAYQEGLGESGKKSMEKVQQKMKEKMSEENEKLKISFFKMLNSPREYAPLTPEFKIV